MKYGQTIRDWRYYDENFIYLRRTQASLVPWGSIHGELWLRSQYPVRAPPNKQMSGISKTVGPSVPSGFCFKFHRGQFCATGSCGFKHTCFKCNKGTHRVSQCNCRGSTSKSNASADRQAKSPNTSQAQTSS